MDRQDNVRFPRMSLEMECKDDETVKAKPIRVSATAPASTSTSQVRSDSYTGRGGTASRFVIAMGNFLFGTSASMKKATPHRVDSESTSKGQPDASDGRKVFETSTNVVVYQGTPPWMRIRSEQDIPETCGAARERARFSESSEVESSSSLESRMVSFQSLLKKWEDMSGN
jgi:hypothetical protein